jgi:hypothetical protein
MKTLLRPLALAFLFLAGSWASTARATLLFVNATDATGGGNSPFSSDGVYVAQDFFLAGASTLTSFTFNAYTDGTTLPVTDINLAIYVDNAGTVGGELMRGTFSLAGAPVFTESLFGLFDLYDFTIDLPAWDLAGGNYWLGLNVGPAQPGLQWSVPGDNLGLVMGDFYPGWIGDSAGDEASYVNGYDWEHVFRFDGTTVAGVPDHGATALLLGLGLATLTLGRRHRRAD